ncbi:hypothetical protein [Streptomyces sp. WMMC940]|uniref:hypothetical protein n=1 Tax=Streptomyces sp. WMMC940 TaxID=3015153 RepID=UPI0022B6F618|nr:hypothetical protein [Streptomyces sp. WMMC940]MCZ7459788.1 hypothetical protein [Streptomyces sp. WMMC940]
MTNSKGRFTRGRKAIIAALALCLVAAGVHVSLNTNLFGRDRVCGGLVPAGKAADAFGESGRISDGVELNGEANDPLTFDCIVDSTSFALGFEVKELRVSGERARGALPDATLDQVDGAARMSYFTGDTTGGVYGRGGWILLPASCTNDAGPATARVSLGEDTDPLATARLLTEVANNAAKKAKCAGEKPLAAPQAVTAAAQPSTVKDGEVCGLGGLTFPGRKFQAGSTERVQDRAKGIWACEVEDRATYVATQDPHLLAGIQASPEYEKQQPVEGLNVSGFDDQRIVADCSGTPTYFSLKTGQAFQDDTDYPETPKWSELMENFVKVAGKQYGCSGR